LLLIAKTISGAALGFLSGIEQGSATHTHLENVSILPAMGIFNKPVTKAAISTPSVQAAVGYAPTGNSF
jgi:hypothetical protein